MHQAYTARLVPIAALLIAFAGTGATRAQQAIFKARTETVRLDVLVTDKGQPVAGLQPGDFEVLDNGVPQQVELFDFGHAPMHLVLALDVSASVEGERLARLVEGCAAVLDGLRDADQVSLLTFNHALSLRAGPTSDVAQVRAMLADLTGLGATSLLDAAYAGMLIGQSSGGRPLVIVFSDGVDTSSWLREADVLRAVKRSDVLVYAVSVGEDPPQFLRDLTATTGGNLFQAGGNRDLKGAFLRVLTEFKSRYLLGYHPQQVAETGWHTLDVRVRGRGFKVRARPGYSR
jgi:VWFA-related protein